MQQDTDSVPIIITRGESVCHQFNSFVERSKVYATVATSRGALDVRRIHAIGHRYFMIETTSGITIPQMMYDTPITLVLASSLEEWTTERRELLRISS